MRPNSSAASAAPFIRIADLATDRKAGKIGLLPMSKATIWNNVRKGSFPKPVKLTENITAEGVLNFV